MALDITLGAVLVTAIVDSINPCAIGVLILLLGFLSRAQTKRMMVTIGLLYISIIYITYFLAGVGLLIFIQRLGISIIVGIIVGILVILLGLIEIKDFFWYGKGFSLTIPPRYVGLIKKWAKKATFPAIVVLGFIVAAVELPCTGGPYLAITTLLSKESNIVAIYYLLLYNFIFVLPLIIILILAYLGTSVKAMREWKMKHRKWMRLSTGIVLVALGILLILYSKGYINFGF